MRNCHFYLDGLFSVNMSGKILHLSRLIRNALVMEGSGFVYDRVNLKAGPPLEAILVIFGHRALIFFFLKALGKK